MNGISIPLKCLTRYVKVIERMVEKKRMTIRKVDAARDNPRLDALLKSGIMREEGIDQITFAHNILFDHAVGRFYWERDDFNSLMVQIKATTKSGFFLGPSFKYMLGIAWVENHNSKKKIWDFLRKIYAAEGIDPIIRVSILRSIIELIVDFQDVLPLCDLMGEDDSSAKELGGLLSFLARFWGLHIEEGSGKDINISTAKAWLELAVAAVGTGSKCFSDCVRMILRQLSNIPVLTNPELRAIYGEVSRKYLELEWEIDLLDDVGVGDAIRFVCRTYSTDPTASKRILQRILTEPHFSRRAHIDAGPLAEGTVDIVQTDPDFVVDIYATLFGREFSQQGQSAPAVPRSIIVPIIFEPRQLYEFSRHYLEGAFTKLLQHSATHATQVVSTIFISSSRYRLHRRPIRQFSRGNGLKFEVFLDDYSSSSWDKGDKPRGDPESNIFGAYLKFLLGCSKDQFQACVETAVEDRTAASVWVRILYTAVNRNDVPDDLLWPIVTNLEFTGLISALKDVVSYVVAAYPKRTIEERVALENAVVRQIRMEDGVEGSQTKVLARCLLLDMSDESFVTAKFKALRTMLNIEKELPRECELEGAESYASWGNQHDDIGAYIVDSGPRRVAEGPLVERRQELREMVSSEGYIDKKKIVCLWGAISDITEMIDRLVEGDQHGRLLHESWGLISLAARKIAENGEYSPESEDHPGLNEILKILDRMAGSKYPEPNIGNSGHLASSPEEDVRVNVSESVMKLAVRFTDRWPWSIEFGSCW